MSAMRKGVIFGIAAVGAALIAGIAYAIVGIVTLPDAATGQATTGQATSCQTTAVTFDWPTPTWSNTQGDYVVETVNYSGIDSTCVSAGNADLTINVTNGSSTSIASGTANNMSASNGTITLNNAILFSQVTGSQINFIVVEQ